MYFISEGSCQDVNLFYKPVLLSGLDHSWTRLLTLLYQLIIISGSSQYIEASDVEIMPAVDIQVIEGEITDAAATPKIINETY